MKIVIAHQPNDPIAGALAILLVLAEKHSNVEFTPVKDIRSMLILIDDCDKSLRFENLKVPQIATFNEFTLTDCRGVIPPNYKERHQTRRR